MHTPWTNKEKMVEIVSKQADAYMRFPIKTVVLECVCDIEEDIENYSKSSKPEVHEKQTGKSNKNKKRKNIKGLVKAEKRYNPIQVSKIKQNNEVLNGQPNQLSSNKKFYCDLSEPCFPFEGEVGSNEEQPSFSEESIKATMEEKTFSSQFDEGTKEADNEKHTPVLENEATTEGEEHTVPSEGDVMTTIDEASSIPTQMMVTEEGIHEEYSTIPDSEPTQEVDEYIPSSERDVKTATEEEPPSFQLSKAIADTKFIENHPLETNVEMGYDQANQPVLEESGQKNNFHDGTVDEKDSDRIMPIRSDNMKPYFEDQEAQSQSNDHKEEQLSFSNVLIDINRLDKSHITTDGDYWKIHAPVILGKYNVDIFLEDEEIFAENVKEIREISKKVVLETCEFIPTELSPVLDDGSCKALKGKLMIEGFIQQDIKYIFENQQTSEYLQNQLALYQKNSMNLRKYNFGRYSYVLQPYRTKSPNPESGDDYGKYTERLINSMSKTIPFSSVVEINNFLHPPLFGSTEAQTFKFQNKFEEHMSHGASTQFITTTYYPENTSGKLFCSKIHEDIHFFKHKEKYIKAPKIKLKQLIVVELWIHLLQEQSVQLQIPKNGS